MTSLFHQKPPAPGSPHQPSANLSGPGGRYQLLGTKSQVRPSVQNSTYHIIIKQASEQSCKIANTSLILQTRKLSRTDKWQSYGFKANFKAAQCISLSLCPLPQHLQQVPRGPRSRLPHSNSQPYLCGAGRGVGGMAVGNYKGPMRTQSRNAHCIDGDIEAMGGKGSAQLHAGKATGSHSCVLPPPPQLPHPSNLMKAQTTGDG